MIKKLEWLFFGFLLFCMGSSLIGYLLLTGAESSTDMTRLIFDGCTLLIIFFILLYEDNKPKASEGKKDEPKQPEFSVVWQ